VVESTERWLPVVGYEGLYEVSDQGRVQSLDRVSKERRLKGRILKGGLSSNKRLTINLCRDGVQRSRMIYQIMMEAFVGPYPEGMEIRHLDGDPANCALENLRYGTRSENRRDSVVHGTHYQSKKTHCPYNHEYTEENTRINKKGARYCVTCMNHRNHKKSKNSPAI